jgi:putative phosphoribosyl transferase
MSAAPYFNDRYEAGRRLATALRERELDRPLIVLGVPRGGVPVAWCVAEDLDAPLDICVVRKLGLPGHQELAIGAIASGGARVLNADVVDYFGISPETIERVVAREQRELERREAACRGVRPFPRLAGETVIVVDDGAATGASMHAAVVALRQLQARAVIAAIPVASRQAVRMLRAVADDCVCIAEPDPFFGVGLWYRDFSETTAAEVRVLLSDAQRRWQAARYMHV